MCLREFQDLDLEPLRVTFNDIVARGDAFVYDEPLTADAFRDYLDGFTAKFVAESDGRIVGGYVLRPTLPGRGGHVANAAYMVAAVALWKRLGFEIIGTVPAAFRHADGRLHDLHVMHRSL